MGRDETTEVRKEILLLMGEVEAGFDALQASLHECLAIAKDTTAILAERRGPGGPQ